MRIVNPVAFSSGDYGNYLSYHLIYKKKNMSLDEMEEDTNPKTKRYLLRRSIMDMGMGLLYIIIALLIIFAKQFGLHNDFAETFWGKIFAGIFILYGIWRFYRGIMKNYLKER